VLDFLQIAMDEGRRRGAQWNGFALLRVGLRNYVFLLESPTGETLKVRIRKSDGAIKQVTSESR
jgi:hypothetical protein